MRASPIPPELAQECVRVQSDGRLLIPDPKNAPTGFEAASILILARDHACDMSPEVTRNRFVAPEFTILSQH